MFTIIFISVSTVQLYNRNYKTKLN